MTKEQAGALLAAFEFHRQATTCPSHEFLAWAGQRDATLKQAIGLDLAGVIALSGVLGAPEE